MARQKDKIIHTQKEASVKDAITHVMVEEKKREQGVQLSILDELRRSRAARGGVGAPLAIPAHLKPGSDIIITDADLKMPESREEVDDFLNSDDTDTDTDTDDGG